MINSQAFVILIVFSNNMKIDFSTELIFNNYNKMRDRNLSTNRSISRDILISLTKSLVVYHERIIFNNLNNKQHPITI